MHIIYSVYIKAQMLWRFLYRYHKYLSVITVHCEALYNKYYSAFQTFR